MKQINHIIKNFMTEKVLCIDICSSEFYFWKVYNVMIAFQHYRENTSIDAYPLEELILWNT